MLLSRCAIVSALVLPLVLATSAIAQAPVGASSQSRVFGPSYVPPDASHTLPVSTSGFNLAREPYTEEDGSPAVRRGVVGSLPLAPNLSLGIGLLQVNRTKQRERALARTRPMRDVGGSRNRIAAVGLSFRF